MTILISATVRESRPVDSAHRIMYYVSRLIPSSGSKKDELLEYLMALHMDPAGDEVRALAAAVDWRDKQVIELGCGDGRLTLRLASLGAAHIEALDPDPDSIKLAEENLPRTEKQRINYYVGQAEALKYPPGAFDIAVFSWVL